MFLEYILSAGIQYTTVHYAIIQTFYSTYNVTLFTQYKMISGDVSGRKKWNIWSQMIMKCQ